MAAVLRVLGEAAGADRVVLFQFRAHSISGRPVCSLTAEWARDSNELLLGRSELLEATLAHPEAATEIAAGRLPAGLCDLFAEQRMKDMLSFEDTNAVVPAEAASYLLLQKHLDLWLEGQRMGDWRRNPDAVSYILPPGDNYYKPEVGLVSDQTCLPVPVGEKSNNLNF